MVFLASLNRNADKMNGLPCFLLLRTGSSKFNLVKFCGFFGAVYQIWASMDLHLRTCLKKKKKIGYNNCLFNKELSAQLNFKLFTTLPHA